jgi:Protein of unknown function (DUF3592)
VDVSFRGRAGVGLGVSLGAVVLLFSGVLDSLAPTPRGLILVAAGVTLLGVVLPLQLRTRALLKHGAKVQGTVVDVEEDTGRGYDNLPSRTYHPVVEFTTADGRTVTFTSGLGFSGRQPRIGSAVPVRYHHDDPEQAQIDRAYIWMVPAAPPLLVGLGLLVAAVVAYTDEPQVAPAAEESQVTPAAEESQVTPAAEESQVTPTVVDSPDDSVTEEPVPIEPQPAKVATGRIGDTLTVTDRTGKAQLEIAVTRVAFSTGHQATRYYMGVHVKAHALADEQHLIIAALVDGHYYDELALVSSAGFQPMLGVDELSLHQGQRVAGWLELDVPSRHGQLVLRDETLQHKVAVWTY